MNSSEQNPKTEEKDVMDKLIPSKSVLTAEFFRLPLNQKIVFFITNPSEDKSKGSSLYFVSPRGTIRCRSDHTSQDRPPCTTTNPFMVGYNKHRKPITTFEATLGFCPFETEIFKTNITNLQFLNLVNEKKIEIHNHKGYPITEIISLEQFIDPTFMPKTWVNNQEVGLLWSSAVDQIIRAKKSAILSIYGHFMQRKMMIQVHAYKKAQPDKEAQPNTSPSL